MIVIAKSELFTLMEQSDIEVPGLGGNNVEISGVKPKDNYGREELKQKELPEGAGGDGFKKRLHGIAKKSIEKKKEENVEKSPDSCVYLVKFD